MSVTKKTRKSDLLIDNFGEEAGEAIGIREVFGEVQVERRGNFEVARARSENSKYASVICGEVWRGGFFKDELVSLLEEIYGEFIVKARAVFAAGIGNPLISADSFGPKCVGFIKTGEKKGGRVIALSPGIPTQTGIDTSRIIGIISQSEGADIIVTFDSLCTSLSWRLGTMLQVTDIGLTPGSALEHISGEISRKTMPCNVVSVGVPTVMSSDGILLAPAEVKKICSFYAECAAEALNRFCDSTWK